MRLIVNGEEYQFRGIRLCEPASRRGYARQEATARQDGSLVSLLDELGANTEHVATMVNGEIIGKKERRDKILYEGDNVEVLTLAAGG